MKVERGGRDVLERWECVECGGVVPDERGHVHVQERDGVMDAYTSSPTRRFWYVRTDTDPGAVDDE